MDQEVFKLTAKQKSRIMHDIEECANEPGFEIGFAVEDQLNTFYVRTTAQDDNYKGIVMVIRIAVRNYPITCFHLVMETPRMFHPNISSQGSICVDFLYDASKWVPEYTFVSGIRAFMLLLQDPNADGGHYNPEASALWRDCKKAKDFTEYAKAVKAKTSKYSTAFDKYFEPPLVIAPSKKKHAKVEAKDDDDIDKIAEKMEKVRIKKLQDKTPDETPEDRAARKAAKKAAAAATPIKKKAPKAPGLYRID